MVIYCHSTVILSFCVIKLYYDGHYCEMAVNYQGICETSVIKHNLTKIEVNYRGISNLEKLGFYYCSNLPQYLFYNIGPRQQHQS
jgi:hypothetical protein